MCIIVFTTNYTYNFLHSAVAVLYLSDTEYGSIGPLRFQKGREN